LFDRLVVIARFQDQTISRPSNATSTGFGIGRPIIVAWGYLRAGRFADIV